MEVRSELDSVTTPRPYWKCLMYAPSSRAFKGSSWRGTHLDEGQPHRWVPKKSLQMNLQASKKSKRLQEQQSQAYFNTPLPSSLTISAKSAGFRRTTPEFTGSKDVTTQLTRR